jgi:hypothetical protein
MVYKPNIPQAADFISQSQKDMIGNFETASYIWGKQDAENENIGDHISLTNPKEDDQGLHKKLTFVEQTVEPAPGVNEITLFTKDTSAQPELFYRRDGDAAGIQLTSQGGIIIGGLVLRAFVIFDSQGKIMQREELDEEGETIKVDLSYNVASVTPNVALIQGKNLWSDWNINFANNLPTADFFWDYRAYGDKNYSIFSQRMVQAQPYGTVGTVYADACSTSRFRAYSKNIVPDGTTIIGESGPVFERLQRMVFQAYTVA